MTDETQKRETSLRNKLKRRHCKLCKRRGQGYRIESTFTTLPVKGEDYSLSLEDVAAYVEFLDARVPRYEREQLEKAMSYRGEWPYT